MPRVQFPLRVPDHEASVAFSTRLHAAAVRLSDAGLATVEENDTTCCYAVQDKVWVHGPGREPWEVYVVKADADTLTDREGSACCTPPDATAVAPPGVIVATASSGCC